MFIHQFISYQAAYKTRRSGKNQNEDYPFWIGIIVHVWIDITPFHAAFQSEIIIGVPKKPDRKEIDSIIHEAGYGPRSCNLFCLPQRNVFP